MLRSGRPQLPGSTRLVLQPRGVAAVAVVAECVDRASWIRTGLCGEPGACRDWGGTAPLGQRVVAAVCPTLR